MNRQWLQEEHMCVAGLRLLSDGEICIWLTDVAKKKKEDRMYLKYFCYTEFLVFYPLLYKLLLLFFFFKPDYFLHHS